MTTNKELKLRAKQLLGNHYFKKDWLFPVLALLILSAALELAGALTFGIGTIAAFGFICTAEARYFLGIKRGTVNKKDMTVLFNSVKDKPLDQLFLGLTHMLFVFLWTLLLIIPGIIKSYAYSMAYYIKLDHPEYTAKQALKASEELMYGHKWQLFLLDLSFIGWFLLGIVTFGAALVWAAPYMGASKVEFYHDLTKGAVVLESITL